MQHDTNIEDKLRQMEALEQPDLSQMDKHWQQMQAILQPGSLPVQKGWPKWMLNTLSIAAVVVLIGAAVLYTSSKKNNGNAVVAEERKIAAAAQNNIASNENESTITDTAITKEPEAALNKPMINTASFGKYENQGSGNTENWVDDALSLGDLKLNYIPCETCPGKEAGILSNAERQVRLTSLFSQLEKKEQHFAIDNSRDTLLQFEEGTALLVPANSFGGMNGVELTAKEFYKISDIVLNQLTTESNKEQLETGGMLELKAGYKGNEVKINDTKPLMLFVPETKDDMKNMRLFFGENVVKEAKSPEAIFDSKINNIVGKKTSNSINWTARAQYFLRRRMVTEARVLNVADIPWLVKETEKKKIGYFTYNEDSMVISKSELKKILKEKYGYTKVKLTSSIRNRFVMTSGSFDDAKFDRRYSEHLGDSLWMDKTTADMYRLNTSVTRKRIIEETAPEFYSFAVNRPLQIFLPARDTIIGESRKAIIVPDEINSRYSINLSQLGWINCDRFYSDSRKKINYKVDLADSATNYYTMLVFENIRSMMTGYIDDNKVTFQNIPVGEPVKVISIGINKKGETVYSVTHTTTSDEELKGLQFRATSVPDLKTALSKYDK